jgi:hypothetical protein
MADVSVPRPDLTRDQFNFLVKIGQITKDGASAASETTPTTEATKAEDK